MTILAICAVKDMALDAYAPPMFVPHVNIAIRSFTDEVNRADQQNQLYRHPDDFLLYHMGNYDTDNGKFIQNDEHPRLLARAKDVTQTQAE